MARTLFRADRAPQADEARVPATARARGCDCSSCDDASTHTDERMTTVLRPLPQIDFGAFGSTTAVSTEPGKNSAAC
jgi:hypothetical protein